MSGTGNPHVTTEIFLVRHGETAWSKSGQHTGRTDLPLTDNGERRALELGSRLRGAVFGRVLTSPLMRAVRTCELAGFGKAASIDEDLREWDYGNYEGLRSGEIHALRPGWNIFRNGCPGGESPEQAMARADRVIGRIRGIGGTVAVFTHGHFGRMLAVRWLGLEAEFGQHLELDPATLSVLGFDPGYPLIPVISLWNEGAAARGGPT